MNVAYLSRIVYRCHSSMVFSMNEHGSLSVLVDRVLLVDDVLIILLVQCAIFVDFPYKHVIKSCQGAECCLGCT